MSPDLPRGAATDDDPTPLLPGRHDRDDPPSDEGSWQFLTVYE
ncbi:MAG: hypothetical protein NVV70_03675 [Cellulomonas sp.]|nr:hypothetical protein [Cellulomonas sp.]MCR6647267.1 hypothetical protein [Cellulomonas sp.]